MSSYQRPPIDAPVFHDSAGQIIEYGNRWPEEPPQDTYSVESHPERFAPIRTVADALIAHLIDTYDVEIEEGEQVVADLLRTPHHDVARAVRVRPNDPGSAPLTFVFTAYPGVTVHAGLLQDVRYPVCGCDACDANWEWEADDLERQVLAVVTGHYRETFQAGSNAWIEHAIALPDGGGRSSRTQAEDIPAARLQAALPVLLTVIDGWSEWPRRVASAV